MVVTQWECGAVVRHSACIHELPTVYLMSVTPIYSTSTCWTLLLLGCKHTAPVCIQTASVAALPRTGPISSCMQDTKIRVLLDGPPAPPSPVPEVNEQDDSESTRTGTASAGGHDAMHPAAAHGTGAQWCPRRQ